MEYSDKVSLKQSLFTSCQFEFLHAQKADLVLCVALCHILLCFSCFCSENCVNIGYIHEHSDTNALIPCFLSLCSATCRVEMAPRGATSFAFRRTATISAWRRPASVHIWTSPPPSRRARWTSVGRSGSPQSGAR